MFIFTTSFGLSLILTGLIIHYQHIHDHLSGDNDFTSPQKFHFVVTPRIGGISIFVSISFVMLYTSTMISEQKNFFIYLIISSLPIFFVGIAEDITKSISIKIRLFTSFFSGLFFLWLFNITSIRFGIDIVDALIQYSWFTVIFLAISMVGLSNAYNLIDGFNGLSSMIAIISFFAVGYVAIEVNDLLVFYISLILIGAIAGFFIWNFPKGLVFLGDGGAYLIGFIMAAVSILIVSRNDTVSPWFPIMVNAYPIFETLFTIWRRLILQSKNPTLPDRLHFHSLIYRRIVKFSLKKSNLVLANAKTSPYLWVLSCFGVIPAILWWNSTNNLILSAFVFITVYCFFYRRIILFRK